MGRCRKRRRIERQFEVRFFKPRGIPLTDLQGVSVPSEGIEAMRLVDALGLSQEEAAGRMEISAPTLCRILTDARSKVARALGSGMAIRIEDPDEPASDDSCFRSGQACGDRPDGHSGETPTRTNDTGENMGFGQGGGRCGGGQNSQKGSGRGCGRGGSVPVAAGAQDTAESQAGIALAQDSQAAGNEERPTQRRRRDGSCGRKG